MDHGYRRRAGLPATPWPANGTGSDERRLQGARCDGRRHIEALDLFSVSPRLEDAERFGPILGKAALVTGLEVKAIGGGYGPVRPQRRPGLPKVVTVACAACGRPAAGVVGDGLQPGESLICAGCLRSVRDNVRAGMLGDGDTDTSVIMRDELAEAAQVDEVSTEEEFRRALDEQGEWELDRDATRTRSATTTRPSGWAGRGRGERPRTGRAGSDGVVLSAGGRHHRLQGTALRRTGRSGSRSAHGGRPTGSSASARCR